MPRRRPKWCCTGARFSSLDLFRILHRTRSGSCGASSAFKTWLARNVSNGDKDDSNNQSCNLWVFLGCFISKYGVHCGAFLQSSKQLELLTLADKKSRVKLIAYLVPIFICLPNAQATRPGLISYESDRQLSAYAGIIIDPDHSRFFQIPLKSRGSARTRTGLTCSAPRRSPSVVSLLTTTLTSAVLSVTRVPPSAWSGISKCYISSKPGTSCGCPYPPGLQEAATNWTVFVPPGAAAPIRSLVCSVSQSFS